MESIKVGSVFKHAVGMGEGVKFTLSFNGALTMATCSSEHLAKIAPSHARFRL